LQNHYRLAAFSEADNTVYILLHDAQNFTDFDMNKKALNKYAHSTTIYLQLHNVNFNRINNIFM